MNDARMLLAACVADPEEDTARLALADELAQIGYDGAAQYIRADIEAHRATQPLKDVARKLSLHWSGSYCRFLQEVVWRRTNLRAAVFEPMAVSVRKGEAGSDWSARLHLKRGLPCSLATDLPFFMDERERLFRLPITAVSVRDRVPFTVELITQGSVTHIWRRSLWPQKFNTWVADADHIPAPIYDIMIQENHTRPGRFSSIVGATRALRDATIAYGIASRREPTPVDEGHTVG